MTKKIDILGLSLDNYTVREAIRQVETFLENNVLNTIENISMQMLIDAEESETLREVIQGLDLAIIGEKEILQVAGIDTMQRIPGRQRRTISPMSFLNGSSATARVYFCSVRAKSAF